MSEEPAEDAVAEAEPASSPPQGSSSGDEDELFEAHPAMLRARPFLFSLLAFVAVGGFAGSIFLVVTTGLLGLAGLVVPLAATFALFWWWLQCKRTTLTVTSSRTQLREGLLSKHTTEVWHSHVRNVQVEQSVTERIFNLGTISIASAGKSDFEIRMSGVPNVKKIKDLIDKHRVNQGPQHLD